MHRQYAWVTEQLAKETLDQHLFDDLRKRMPDWIAAGGQAEVTRRRFAAAALAAEVVHAWISREVASDRAAPNKDLDRFGATYRRVAALALISRAATTAAAAAGADSAEAERLWDLVCLATLESANRTAGNWVDYPPDPYWAVLLGEPKVPTYFGTAQQAFEDGRWFRRVLARFPANPALRLAEAEAHEAALTRCSLAFCFDEGTPAVLSDVRKRASASVTQTVQGYTYALPVYDHDLAVENLAGFGRLPSVAAAFAKLAEVTDDPRVRAEANVHLGYTDIRGGRYDEAVLPLTAAEQVAPDSYVGYLAAYLMGRALAGLGRHAEAIAAYRRALAFVPHAHSASTLLGAELLLSDAAADRVAAYAVLDDAVHTSPAPVDPWDWYWLGDARLWSVYIVQLREAIP